LQIGLVFGPPANPRSSPYSRRVGRLLP